MNYKRLIAGCIILFTACNSNNGTSGNPSAGTPTVKAADPNVPGNYDCGTVLGATPLIDVVSPKPHVGDDVVYNISNDNKPASKLEVKVISSNDQAGTFQVEKVTYNLDGAEILLNVVDRPSA